ncbi:recombinase family protein [Paenarthrobacter sp. YIM B13468]|uniref:recombinase family protein n=1 Tax=Paenarthrobacter sp. YIM B13468 TaxID=3366295 RepID=UPI003670D900
MKVIIYTRQSKHREESISHELQEEACYAYAKSKGWEVVKAFNEKGVSGRSIVKRKEFQAAVKMIKDKKAKVLLVWRWTRFARNTLDGLITLKTIEEEAKGQVHCALEPIDRSAMGKFSLTMMLGLAELESDTKKEQWNEALMYRLSRGLPPSGSKQFGYSKANGSYVLKEDEAAILREAYDRYTKGEGARTICEDFNNRGLASAGPSGWHTSGFFDLLDKDFYSGKIVWIPDRKDPEHVLRVDGAHKPILTKAQWAAYRKARESRKMQDRPRNTKWMLHGLVFCGHCGGKMLSHMARGVPNLLCANYNAGGKAVCPGMFRKRSVVQTAVWWWLGSHLDEWASAMPTDDEARISAEKAVADAEAELESANAVYIDYQRYAFENKLRPEISALELARYSAAIDKAQAALNEALAELGSFTPAADVHEQISQGAVLMGFSEERPKLVTITEATKTKPVEVIEEETEISEAATAQFREALSKIIAGVIVLPPTGASPRDPSRNALAEIRVVPVIP